jgi:hypothetical protein
MPHLRLVCCHPLDELQGHIPIVMIYTHVMNKGGKGVISPLDR